MDFIISSTWVWSKLGASPILIRRSQAITRGAGSRTSRRAQSQPQSDGFTAYATHSYRFGGPWVLMSQLTELAPDQMAFLKSEIQNYKSQRSDISAGKVFHILAPAANATDAIQSYNEATGTALAVITRAASSSPSYLFRPKGLQAERRYSVWFETNASVYSQTGAQLMANGVRVIQPKPYSSEVVHIEPQQ